MKFRLKTLRVVKHGCTERLYGFSLGGTQNLSAVQPALHDPV